MTIWKCGVCLRQNLGPIGTCQFCGATEEEGRVASVRGFKLGEDPDQKQEKQEPKQPRK